MPKQRPRSHQLADLAIAHFRQLLVDRNFTAGVFNPDYGYDLIVQTFGENRILESGFVVFQVKCTERLRRSRNGKSVRFRVEKSDLDLWIGEINPFFLIVFDASKQPLEGYWLNIRGFLEARWHRKADAKSVTLNIPIENRVTPGFLDWIRDYKHGILKQVNERIDYGIS